MNTAQSISFPPRTGRDGSDVFQAVVAIVRNRAGGDYHFNFNRVRTANADLLEPSYDNLDTARNFGRLVNRVEDRSGLPPVESTERSAEDVAALCRRFAPPFASATTAMKWDVIWRAAEVLDRAGVPDHLLNRADGVSASDWKAATGRAEDVLAFLDSEATSPVDRGPILEQAPASQIRGVFRRALDRQRREQGLNRRQAFDWLKENEPVFWALSLLSFEPEKPEAVE